jgi:hypothetical protein
MSNNTATMPIDALICIDDTDNLDSPGTGELLEVMIARMSDAGWLNARHITRHQLLIHPDIPYTSHNSSMCCRALIAPPHWQDCIDYCSEFLAQHAAPESDPGLCFVNLNQLQEPATLIAYGARAKQEVLDRAGAFKLAAELGIHLSEHGGTGGGVIGALAGAGLRLGGNDGRMRGHLSVPRGILSMSVAELQALPEVEQIHCLHGQASPTDRVDMGDKPKTVQMNGLAVLLLMPSEGSAPWRTCTRQELKKY